MSLILDALKKAEAERHLGQIPSLHVQPLAVLPADGIPSRMRKIWLGLAIALMIAVSGMLVWLQPWKKQVPSEQSQIAQQVLADNSVSTPSAGSPAHEMPASPPQQIIAASPPLETNKPPAKPAASVKKTPSTPPHSTPADYAASSAPVVKAAPSPNQHTEPSTTTKTTRTSAPASTATTAGVTAVPVDTGSKSLTRQSASHAQPVATSNAEIKTTAPPSADVATFSLRELPEQIQRELPNLIIGGYVYSDNPRERQLLVNRRLLHEGEEAAPGVMLEKMTPKAAVFNYRGYRYRVAY